MNKVKPETRWVYKDGHMVKMKKVIRRERWGLYGPWMSVPRWISDKPRHAWRKRK